MIKKVVFHLSAEETLRLTRILLDEDKEEALFFLRNASNPNWNRRPGTIECRSSRLRISLLKKIRLPRIEDNFLGNYSHGEVFGYI